MEKRIKELEEKVAELEATVKPIVELFDALDKISSNRNRTINVTVDSKIDSSTLSKKFEQKQSDLN